MYIYIYIYIHIYTYVPLDGSPIQSGQMSDSQRSSERNS